MYLVESSFDVSIRILLLMLENIATNSFTVEMFWFGSTDRPLLLQLRLQDPS